MAEKTQIMLIEIVLLPGTQAVLRLMDADTQKAIKNAYHNGDPIGVLYCSDADDAEKTAAKVGCLAKITDVNSFEQAFANDGQNTEKNAADKAPDNGAENTRELVAKLEGHERMMPHTLEEDDAGMTWAHYDLLPEEVDMALDDKIFESIMHLLEIYSDYLNTIDPEMVEDMPDDLSGFDVTYLVLDHMSVGEETRQHALELVSMKARAQFCVTLLRQEIERLKFLIDGATEPQEDETEHPERLN